MVEGTDAKAVILDEFLAGRSLVRVGLATFENLTPEDDPNAVHIRLRVPMKDEKYHANCRTLAYDLVTELLSETTNNDACDVVVRERSAHFDSHRDLDGYHGDEMGWVFIDATIEDFLT